MVKNPPANAGDSGSIPGLGRSTGVPVTDSFLCLAELIQYCKV